VDLGSVTLSQPDFQKIGHYTGGQMVAISRRLMAAAAINAGIEMPCDGWEDAFKITDTAIAQAQATIIHAEARKPIDNKHLEEMMLSVVSKDA
jgi:hypothetical protein